MGSDGMDRERRIEARAYEIWEREGRPEGRHDAHWNAAAREIDAEDGGAESPAMPGQAQPAPAHDGPGIAGKPGRRRAAAAIAAEDAGTAPKGSRARRTKATAD
jgi:hypothetical protein